MKKFTAIVPIRSGSQRVKNKNIRKINNIPLYAYIVRTLKDCKMIDKIIINTDYESIIENYKLDDKVIIMRRDKKLVGNCDINLVIKSTLDNCEGGYFLQTHTTNPLLKSTTIDKSISLFNKEVSIDSLFSVNKLQKRFWSKNNRPINHSLNDEPTTQNLEPYYEENSCMYLFTRESFNNTNNRIGKMPMMFEIPKYESIDIDYLEDFILVNKILK